MIVDASAVVALLFGEPEADLFHELLANGSGLAISSVNFFEACIVADRAESVNGSERLDELLQTYDVDVVPVTRLHVVLAREAYRKFGKGNHPARLNFGDCIAYAVAKAGDDVLLFKGNDFSQTDVRPALTP